MIPVKWSKRSKSTNWFLSLSSEYKQPFFFIEQKVLTGVNVYYQIYNLKTGRKILQDCNWISSDFEFLTMKEIAELKVNNLL